MASGYWASRRHPGSPSATAFPISMRPGHRPRREPADVVTYISAPDDLALHGVRVLGFPSASRVAVRYGLPLDRVEDTLLDFEARGWVGNLSFGGSSGWSLDRKS